MPQTHPAPKGRTRLAAAATGAALVAGVGGLVIAGAPAANAADKNLNKSFNYTCRVVAGAGIDLGNFSVGVRTQVAVPTSVRRGQLIAARKTTITLTLPETLRAATTGLLQGTDVSGASNNASITVTAPGASAITAKIANLAAAKQAIPAASPWTIRTVGDVPAIRVPARAHTSATINMPARFDVAATVYQRLGTTAPVTMACSLGGSRAIGSLAIAKNASKITAKVSPKKIRAKKTKAKLAVRVAAGSPAATGKVTAKVGKKTVGKGTVRNGKVTIKLKKFKKKGTYRVKLTYRGSVYAKGATKTVKVKVRR
ncbi:hypothetical protein KV097_16700 [Mumia sp. zg.B17]|uniref:DUF6801 domain-containing protein n=1 Tax=Mumia sp. zg.B17 TaxID=2855446 RepID=UPI001C6F538F|nr:DUF6801 domain-containing protein [Mumia sp. zg.B17]MBW9207579.1 hypothetical protein [Mumia sp. zg.B17]